MRNLTVLYDARCGFCVRCREWLTQQAQLVPLELLALHSPEAERRFPGLVPPGVREELLAVSDEGGVYRGTRAWIMCLWALREHRAWARRLAHPLLLPFVRGSYALLSQNRHTLSSWLGLAPPAEIAQALSDAEPPRCA